MFELEAMYNWEISPKSAEVDPAGEQWKKSDEGNWEKLNDWISRIRTIGNSERIYGWQVKPTAECFAQKLSFVVGPES